jgi:site-specific recombinase XerD
MNNSKLIEKFELSCASEGLGKLRIQKYHYTLGRISVLIKKDLDKVNQQDLVKFLADIQNSNYSYYTKHDYKVTIKKFYKWLGKEKIVSWIKTSLKKNELPLPEILTREETLKLIQASRTVRDKALVSVLFESGCRIGELLNLKISDVEFDSYGAVLIVKGKTGSRRIRICGQAVAYLKEWLTVNHPTKISDDLVFNISYRGLDKVLKNIGKRADFKKNIHFHMFRHGRATELSTKLTEIELDIFMGWEVGSNMPRTYCHLSGKDIEQKILQISGVSADQKIDNALTKIKIKDPELYRALFNFVKRETEQK